MKCSRAVGKALSYVPGASLVSQAASTVYDGAIDLKDAVKIKASNAFRKLRSKLSSAHPYKPIGPPPKQRASSPTAVSGSIKARLIKPLSYGGTMSTRRSTTHHHHHRHTKKC
jgi:hypothetical protein